MSLVAYTTKRRNFQVLRTLRYGQPSLDEYAQSRLGGLVNLSNERLIFASDHQDLPFGNRRKIGRPPLSHPFLGADTAVERTGLTCMPLNAGREKNKKNPPDLRGWVPCGSGEMIGSSA
jgi:hypothetical protein